jgi:hypothetical protein
MYLLVEKPVFYLTPSSRAITNAFPSKLISPAFLIPLSVGIP